MSDAFDRAVLKMEYQAFVTEMRHIVGACLQSTDGADFSQQDPSRLRDMLANAFAAMLVGSIRSGDIDRVICRSLNDRWKETGVAYYVQDNVIRHIPALPHERPRFATAGDFINYFKRDQKESEA